VKGSRSRRLAAALAVVCGLIQPLVGSNALVGLASLFHSHGHDVSLLADSGHLDLVLSHATGDSPDDPHAAERHFHTASSSHGDHVVHLTSSDAVRDSMRRAVVDARTAILQLPFANRPPVVASAPWLERLAHAPPARQTVVLRI
jgi:hypothetical protein